jgi:RNA polymerase sigma-70 factor, ECF subfamily
MAVPASELSDEALAARAAGDDAGAFEALVLRYQHPVFRLACRLSAHTDAPDIVQETFLQAYRHLSTFRGDAKFSTWLYRIATNACLMLRRTRARRPTESLDEFLPRFDDEGRLEGTADALRVACYIEEMLDRQALARKAQAAIERLPDLYRAAFVLRDLEELPTADVAEVLGVEPATVRQRVHRARLLLRGYLTDLAQDGR